MRAILEELVGACRARAGRGQAPRGCRCTRLYAPDTVQAAAVDAVVLETELRQALKNNELEVVYQPIMRLADSDPLPDLKHCCDGRIPLKGLVGPSGFIGHSEQTGSIVELGKFALQQAATELALWQRYFPLTPPLTVSVNLSRRQLQDTEFEKLLIDVLGKAGLAPGTLKLELTESAVSEIDDAGLRLSRLKAAGAGLAIDDFGTGLSALSQLRGLPFDSLKIDQSFVAQREDAGAGAEGGSSILRSIVGLARELRAGGRRRRRRDGPRRAVAEGHRLRVCARLLFQPGVAAWGRTRVHRAPSWRRGSKTGRWSSARRDQRARKARRHRSPACLGPLSICRRGSH
jgi:EAL domain-containing protein (putative c-di-GMP-specific phosphodiesterase class I)